MGGVMLRLVFFVMVTMGLSPRVCAEETVDQGDSDYVYTLEWQEPSDNYDVSIFKQPWIEGPHTVEGWDWSLPGWVQAAEKSIVNVQDLNPKNHFSGNLYRRVVVSWGELEPEPGVLQLEVLKNAIDKARADGVGIQLSLYGASYEIQVKKKGKWKRSEPGSAPSWLYQKLKKKVKRVYEKTYERKGETYRIVNWDIYDPDYDSFYRKMVLALGEMELDGVKGVFNHPLVDVIYLHTMNSDLGEEGQIGGDPGRNNIFIDRINDFLRVTNDPGKLVVVATWGPAFEYALQQGVGQRGGFIEKYLGDQLMGDLQCQQWTEDNYLQVIKACDLLDGRVFGDENEEYQNSFQFRFGDLKSYPHRYRESMLRFLQMQKNYLWAARREVNHSLLSYVALSLGKTVDQSPDAFSYLRESYVPDYSQGRTESAPARPMKNFERWLYQRDMPQAYTVPTAKVPVPKWGVKKSEIVTGQHKDYPFDYIARKTTSQNPDMLFNVDDDFLALNQSYNLLLKVTLHDLEAGTFDLVYHSNEGEVRVPIETTGDHKLKTITLDLQQLLVECEDERFFNLEPVFDFKFSRGSIDPIISMVRIVKSK